VTGQHPGRVDGADAVKRGDCLRGVERERRRLGTGHAGEHVAGGHGVADEQRVDGGDVDRDAPRRVAWHVDDPRLAGDVKHLAVLDREQVAGRRDLEPALAGRVPQEAEHRPGLDWTPAAVRLLHLEVGAVVVGREQVGRDALLARQPAGEADVVGVAVREDQRPHVIEGQAELCEFPAQQLPVTGQPRVDDRHAVPVDDEVAVDGVRTDPVQTLG
jgi:hypothetical protein